MVNPKSALLFAVLTAGLAYHPASSVAPSSAAAKTPTQAAHTRTVTYDKDLEVRNWPLETIYASFVDKAEAARQATKADPCPYLERCAIKFIVATVPDPQNSQYPLMFDEFMQSIQRAFATRGYNLDQFWLPWSAEPVPLDTDFILREQHKEWLARLQQNPGVLVFRSDSGGRIGVLLTGENPITGINKLEFANAVDIISRFSPSGSVAIPILGPAFSGSFASLGDAIAGLARRYQFRSITGSATYDPHKLRNIPIPHEQAIGSDTNSFDTFLDYALKKTRLEHIAILGESGTEYSEAISRYTDEQGNRITNFEYPMQIARLRNAYGNDPNLGAISQKKDSDIPHEGLEIPLKDEHESEDLIPSFAGEITPVAQEASLLSTLATIDRSHIEYLGIVATDIMDSVFLGRMLRQHCPNTRPFILDADLIYGHIAQNNAFEGMLMATSYPLFHKPGKDKSGLVDEQQFSSAAEEGEYRATLQLISQLDPSLKESSTFKVSQPWLAVIGRDGIWPLQEPFDAAAGPSLLIPFQASLGWKLGFYLVSIFCLAFSWAVIYFNWNQTNQHLPLGWLSSLLANTTTTRVILVLAGALLLSFYGFLTWLELNLRGIASISAVTCFFAIASLLTATLCAGLGKRVEASPLRRLTFQGAASSVVALVACLSLTGHSPSQNAFLYRTLHVGNGVSPIVPLAFLTAALFWLACTHLNRIRILHLFPSASDALQNDTFLCHAEQLQKSLHSILGRWTTGGPRWAGLIAATLLFSVVILNPVRIFSIETFRFEWVYAAGLYVLYFGLLLEFTRFLRTWTTLQSLLRMLERHMLCKAFRRLSRRQSGRPLWHWGGNEHAFTVLATFLNRLKWLSDHQLLRFDTYYENKLRLLQVRSRHLMGGGPAVHLIDAASLDEIKSEINQVFHALVTSMLPEWRTLSATEPLALSSAVAAGAGAAVVTTHLTPRSLATEAHGLAEEMIALRFVELISQVNLQLKNNLEFIAGALILAIVSLNSYPFEPRHSMTSMITIYFFTVSAVFLLVFVQMSRNTIISYLSNTTPGKLDGNIFHVLSFGGLPMLAVLSSQFPSLGGFLFAWVKPALEGLR